MRKHTFAKLLTPEEAATKMKGVTLDELKAAAAAPEQKCQCGRAVWRIACAGMCFTCTTGESDASDDYELAAT